MSRKPRIAYGAIIFMSLFCTVFGFLFAGCTPLEDRIGVFDIKTPGQGHVSCESVDDYEVCAWIEELKLTRFYLKQQDATLYRGTQVLEGRSIQLPDGFETSFSFYWSGPDKFLLGSFFETHTSAMQDLAPTFQLHGLIAAETSKLPIEEHHFGAVARIPTDQFIAGLVYRATCGHVGPKGGTIIILEYPTQQNMLDCLRK
ncbi:MAG: hypothetical protein NXH94_22360 [Rhodobacteraceae bacterium]|nr:hypothetical protein [Paracoccaceae bacterium]